MSCTKVLVLDKTTTDLRSTERVRHIETNEMGVRNACDSPVATSAGEA